MYAQTQAHTQAQQPQGSQPGRPVHPQERNSAFSPIRLSTMPTLGDQTPPLHRGPSEKTLALSPGLPGLCPFSSPHRAPIHLFSYLNKRWDFFSFLCHHKEGGDANRQLNIHGARLPGTSVLRCCKKRGTFSGGRDSPTSLFKGQLVAMPLRGRGRQKGRGKGRDPRTHIAPCHLSLPGSDRGSGPCVPAGCPRPDPRPPLTGREAHGSAAAALAPPSRQAAPGPLTAEGAPRERWTVG